MSIDWMSIAIVMFWGVMLPGAVLLWWWMIEEKTKKK